MSTGERNNGENITKALSVLLETYANIDLLLVEMDKVAEKAGFVAHTSRFMRWKSDVDYNGWLVKSFIKIYQPEGDNYSDRVKDLRAGDLHAVDIDLENDYPQIWLSRHRFDYSGWTRLPSTSEHWLLSYPLYDDPGLFSITEIGDLWRSVPTEKARKNYWGIRGSVALSIPLVTVTSSETIETEVFDRLKSLPEPCSCIG